MLDRDATIAKFGYDPDTLSRGSNKKVVAVCEECGMVRDLERKGYRELCNSCSKKKYYKDPEAREKNIAAQRTYWKDPEVRKKHSAARKQYCKDHPETREKLSAAQKKYWKDPEAHEKQSAVQKKRFEDPKEREKNGAARKKYCKDHPEAHEKLSAAKKKYWKNPEARKKQSVAKKKYFEDPEARQRLSATKQGISYDEWESFAVDQPYCPAFNETCRESNREKYGRRCFICGKHESDNITKNGKQRKLSVHHVDMNKDQGCDGHEWKLVPTCLRHHGTTHTPLWISRITYLLRNIDYNHH